MDADQLTNMTDRQQIDAFANDLARLVNRYRAEFSLPVAAVIGTMEVVKLELFLEAKEMGDDQPGDGPEAPDE